MRPLVKTWLTVLVALVVSVMLTAVPAAGQQVSSELKNRANQLTSLFRDEVQADELFTPAFLAQAPATRLGAISAQLRTQHGAVRGLNRIEPRSATAGTVYVDFERATLRLNLSIEPEAPHRIAGLLITGLGVRGDSFAAIVGEFRNLPGSASFTVARLGNAPAYLAGYEAQRPMAVGSAFKLFVLAELSRQVRAGERRWSDVVTLDRKSLPSGQLQSWPDGSPLTLHSLAALMISVSDNTAADMLLHVLGRENVERMVGTIGVRAAARDRPFLSTREAFALKRGGPEAIRRWAAADEDGKRAILKNLAGAPLGARAGDGPIGIEEAEWFASAEDMVRTMDWLRQNGDDKALAILAINPVIGRDLAREFGYLGVKGGSEPGVINLTFLVRSRSGAWHAVVGSWNNSAAAVDDTAFVTLMTRAVQLIR